MIDEQHELPVGYIMATSHPVGYPGVIPLPDIPGTPHPVGWLVPRAPGPEPVGSLAPRVPSAFAPVTPAGLDAPRTPSAIAPLNPMPFNPPTWGERLRMLVEYVGARHNARHNTADNYQAGLRVLREQTTEVEDGSNTWVRNSGPLHA